MNLHIIIKIWEFLILTWIYPFISDLNVPNYYLDKFCNNNKMLDTRSYRSLTKNKLEKESNIAGVKKRKSIYKEFEKKEIFNNEKESKARNKLSNGRLLNKAQYYTEIIDYNNGMFDGKHFHFQKKWIKKKYYDDFLEKKRRIRDITLKKIKFKNYGFVVAILFIFFLFGLGLPTLNILCSLNIIENGMYKDSLTHNIWEFIEGYINGIGLNKYNIYLVSLSILLVLLAIVVIIVLTRILRNNEKYNKTKLMID
ncbi:fam-m protein [Plasmodium brasilianum]|uniref:fam-m protein n=1 Tax=Plasmodium brasilianum TaxID=5824 RepID=UPI00350E4DF1|nr:fam-m protein [Plasmodium brasilianum]